MGAFYGKSHQIYSHILLEHSIYDGRFMNGLPYQYLPQISRELPIDVFLSICKLQL